MTIYAYNQAVTLTEACMIPVWIVRSPHNIQLHFSEPAKLPKKLISVEQRPNWYARGKFTGITGNGEALCDGKWFEAFYMLRATDGITEIYAEVERLNPDHATKYHEWNKAGSPEATHFFPALPEADIRK